MPVGCPHVRASKLAHPCGHPPGLSRKKETARLFWTVPNLILSLVENSSDRDRRSVIRIGNLDSGLLRARMHDLAISNVDSHMSAVADDIARLSTAQASCHLRTDVSVR